MAIISAVLLLGLVGCVDPPPTPVHKADQQVITTDGPHMWSTIVAHTCNGDFLWNEYAQTFVAGRSGKLDQVSLVVQPQAGPGALGVSIRAVDADGRPTGASLGGGSYTGPGSPDVLTYTDIPLLNPASVTAGQKYAITVSTISVGESCAAMYEGLPFWTIIGETNEPYPAGTWMSRGSTYDWRAPTTEPWISNDLSFRTWVL